MNRKDEPRIISNPGTEPSGEKKPRVSGRFRQRRRIFNILDIVIFLVIAALAVVLIISSSTGNSLFKKKKDGESKTIEYTVFFSNVEEALADRIASGDMVYSDDASVCFGQVITDVEKDEYQVVTYHDDVAEMVSYPDRYNLTVTIRADALYKEGVGFTVDGTRLAVGMNYRMVFPNLSVSGVCISINKDVTK